jgi:quinoprotein glucose dehydrogenase
MPVHTQAPRWFVLAFALSAFVRLAVAADFKQPDPLEPDVARASSEAVEGTSAIRIPAGWQIELLAAEPDVANIVAFDVDNRGRLFVCESFRQNRGVTDNRAHDEAWLLADLAAETVQDRIDYLKSLLGEAAITYAQHDDRMRRLEDSDGDGRLDRSVVLANGFNRIEEGTGAGVLARGADVYFTCIPKLWKLSDHDDDGRADDRAVLSDGYGVRVAFRGHDLHGLVIGPDGRLYYTIGDRGYHVTTADGRVLANPESGAVFRCELDGSSLEVFATGMRNPQELAFNDLGDLFSVDNNSDSGDKARVIQILEGGDSGWRMHYQYLPDRGPFNRDRIWEPFHHEQAAYIVPPIANLTDGPSGLAFYPGTGFGDELKDRFLICDFRGGAANSGVRSFQLEPRGAFYELREQADPIWSVLATDIAFAPDGAIYLSDWVDGWDGLGKGRLYRITNPDHRDTPVVREVQQLLETDWSGSTTEQLAQHLGHTDRRVRLEAQWELARRSDEETLLSVASDPQAPPLARLHAIWGADQIIRLDAADAETVLATIRALLTDSEATVRAAAAKVVGERADSAALTQLRPMLADESARVRYFACLSLARLRDAAALPAVVKLLADNQNADPALRHAAATFLASLSDLGPVAELSTHESESVRRTAVVGLRRTRSAELVRFLADASPLVAIEAARAIYDEPVPVAIDTLAKMVPEAEAPMELVRRILHANYRLGTAEGAARLAEYAGRISAPPELRIEALGLLAAWDSSDPRDRFLNAHRPLPPREAKLAAEALSPQVEMLMASQDAVREKAIEVAALLGIDKIIPLLVQRVNDAQLPPTVRATALTALARLDRTQAVALSHQVKMLPATELLHAALSVLAKYDAASSLGKFIEATQSRSMEVRQLAWDILAGSDAPEALAAIIGGVQAYLSGELPSDVQLNVLDAAKGKLDDKLQQAVIEHDRALAAGDPLAPWLVALDGGNVEQGSRIFFESTKLSCLRCHKVDRAGGEVGPNLTSIGKQKDRRYLLESICLPSAQIASGFETAVIADDSGRVLTGIVRSENAEFVELVHSDGTLTRIAVEEVVARRKGKSSMPEDLTTYLSLRQLRDLVAYLASLQVDPSTAAEVE